MEKLEKFLNDKTKYKKGHLLIKYEDVAEFYALVCGENELFNCDMEKVVNWNGYSIPYGINPTVLLNKDCLAIDLEELGNEHGVEEKIMECIDNYFYDVQIETRV